MKGITIGEKCPRGKTPDTTPTKKGKMAFDAKKKGPISPPKDKKRATPTQAANKGETFVAAPGEGTSSNPGAILGPRASMLESPLMVEKILGGVIPPADKKKWTNYPWIR